MAPQVFPISWSVVGAMYIIAEEQEARQPGPEAQ